MKPSHAIRYLEQIARIQKRIEAIRAGKFRRVHVRETHVKEHYRAGHWRIVV